MKILDVFIGFSSRKPVFCQIKFRNKELTIHGVVDPKPNGNARCCGQIISDVRQIEKFAPGWNAKMRDTFVEYWEKWHLNDMRPGCIHQMDNWNIGEKIKLVKLGYGPKYITYSINNRIDVTEYVEVLPYLRLANKILIKDNQGFIDDRVQNLIDRKFLRIRGVEVKTRGWVYPKQHPKGLLTKPCEICGYKYGTEWKRIEVPESVLDFLFSLPSTNSPSSRTPAWI